MKEEVHYQNLYGFSQKNLRLCQLKQIAILKEIDRICRKYHIDYWLDGGTLLGAVRHQGFIPWDDDIDIAMDEKDLKRFEEIAPSELRDGLFLQTPKTDPYVKEPIVKVRDLNSLFIEKGDHFEKSYIKGIYVDIFPFTNHPDVPKMWIKTLHCGISKSNSILHHQHYYSFRAIAELLWFGIKRSLYKVMWIILLKLFKSTHYANVPEINGYGVTHLRSEVLPVSSVIFENESFPAPHNPEKYLQNIYGDYMRMPSREKRKHHAVFILPMITDSPNNS